MWSSTSLPSAFDKWRFSGSGTTRNGCSLRHDGTPMVIPLRFCPLLPWVWCSFTLLHVAPCPCFSPSSRSLTPGVLHPARRRGRGAGRRGGAGPAAGNRYSGLAKRSASGKAMNVWIEPLLYTSPLARVVDVLDGRARKAAVFVGREVVEG